jgi:hypothetical protein
VVVGATIGAASGLPRVTCGCGADGSGGNAVAWMNSGVLQIGAGVGSSTLAVSGRISTATNTAA